MQRLNLKQIERYHEDGFLVVRNFFTIEECDKLKKILIEEISKGQDILKKTPSETIDKIDANKLADYIAKHANADININELAAAAVEKVVVEKVE